MAPTDYRSPECPQGTLSPRKGIPGQAPVVLDKATESDQSETNEKRAPPVDERPLETTTDPDALLTPSEVAAMFRVNPKTVTRWARAGKISAIRTLGGHRRFRAAEIKRFLEQVEEGAETP